MGNSTKEKLFGMSHRKGPSRSCKISESGHDCITNDVERGTPRKKVHASMTIWGRSRRRPFFQQKVRRLWFLAVVILVHAAVALLFTKQLFFSDESSRPTRVTWDTFRHDYKRRYHRPPPESLRQWLEFAQSRDCEPMRFYDAIDRDLAVFRNRNKKLRADQVVAEATTYTNYYAVFSLENNRLTIEKWETIFDLNSWLKWVEAAYFKLALRWLLQPLVHHKPAIRNKFVFNLHDAPTNVRDAKAPIFSSCHLSDDNNNLFYDNRTTSADTYHPVTTTTTTLDLLVPYYFSIGFAARGLWFWPFFSRGSEWKKRKDTITWRGSTTGTWLEGHRFHLLEQYGGTDVHPIAENVPVEADFAFSRVVQNDGQDLDTNKFRLADRMSYGDIQAHKYVLDVDGNSFTERFPKLLRSGTLVFKSTTYREWFSERVQPWVDYVPVNYDLSDLIDKVAWAHSRQTLAQGMAEHAKKVVEKHVRPEDQQCYTYRLMLEYQALFD